MTEINKGIVMFLCDYNSYYGGNFIPSLMALEEKLKIMRYNCVYVLPKLVQDRFWVKQLQKYNHIIEFLDFAESRKNMILNVDYLVKKYKVSILHIHFGQTLNMEMYSLINKKVKVFIHLHSDFSAGKMFLKEKLVNYILYYLCSKKVQFLSVSKALKYKNNKRTTWIPNGLAIKRIPCKHRSGKEIRNEYHVKDNDIFCEIFGWSPDIKGVDVAVKAIKILNEKCGISVKLGIVCGREMTCKKMMDYVGKYIGSAGDESYFIYLKPIEDVFAYHEAADILISASRSEGFSYAILEMLSIGKKCVISDIPGVAWAKDYPVSFMFESENINDCVEAIRAAIRYESKDNAMLVKNDIKEKYSIDKWVAAVIDSYSLK